MRSSWAALPAIGAALMLAVPAGAAQTDILISVCTGDGIRLVALAHEPPEGQSKHNCQKACHALCGRKKGTRKGTQR